MRKKISILSVVISMFAFLILISAGNSLNTTAYNMKELKSESGTSLAEAYYQQVGGISRGLGLLCDGLAFSELAITIAIVSFHNSKEQKVNIYGRAGAINTKDKNSNIERDYMKLNQ